MNVSCSKVHPSSKGTSPPRQSLLSCGEGENTPSKLSALRLRGCAKGKPPIFYSQDFHKVVFFTEHSYFSHPLLSDHPLFCNQRVELAELKWLGSCRDETQLNKQILKWCLDGRTWTWFRFFFLNSFQCVIESCLLPSWQYIIYSALYWIILLRVENKKGTILSTLIIEEEQLCLWDNQ